VDKDSRAALRDPHPPPDHRHRQPSAKTIDALMKLDLPSGVDIEV
jgi:hypothetical protein